MDKTNLTQKRQAEDDSDVILFNLDAFEDAIDEPCLYDELMDLDAIRRGETRA